MKDKLLDSYRSCWQIVRQSGSSFHLSFYLLSPPARDAMAALYAFARITDNLGDGDSEPLTKQRLLDQWRNQLQNMQRTLDPPSSIACEQIIAPDNTHSLAEYARIWPALADAVARFSIPVAHLEEIITGVDRDIDPVRISDWPELEDYCYYVAASVGLACARIWQADREFPEQVAIACGQAFQLTNILRDLREDAAMGRIYIPQSELEHFGCSRQAWLAGRPDGDWQSCVDRVASVAREKYAIGWQTHDFLCPEGRKMFSLIWRTYKRLLDEICRTKEKLWTSKKTRIPKSARCYLAVSHFVSPAYQRLGDPIERNAKTGKWDVARARVN